MAKCVIFMVFGSVGNLSVLGNFVLTLTHNVSTLKRVQGGKAMCLQDYIW